MYGKIEKATHSGQGIYKVTLNLLSVPRKQLTASTVENLPMTDASGVKVQTYARSWYSKLAGAGSGGTLVVRANIDRGTVILDEDIKGTLASGTLTLTGVAEGKHTLAVEGNREYQRYEAQITVRTGETTTQSVTMVAMPKKVADMQPTGTITREGTVTQPPSKTNVWKPVFYGSAAVDVLAGGFTVLAWQEGKSKSKVQGGSDSGKCGDSAASAGFRTACNWYRAQIVGWAVIGAASAAVIGSFYMAYLRDSGSSESSKTVGGGHRKRRELVVTPVVTPDGGGATLRFDW
jgi:hypothetical protein